MTFYKKTLPGNAGFPELIITVTVSQRVYLINNKINIFVYICNKVFARPTLFALKPFVCIILTRPDHFVCKGTLGSSSPE